VFINISKCAFSRKFLFWEGFKMTFIDMVVVQMEVREDVSFNGWDG
jgi:hypothetical protein